MISRSAGRKPSFKQALFGCLLFENILRRSRAYFANSAFVLYLLLGVFALASSNAKADLENGGHYADCGALQGEKDVRSQVEKTLSLVAADPLAGTTEEFHRTQLALEQVLEDELGSLSSTSSDSPSCDRAPIIKDILGVIAAFTTESRDPELLALESGASQAFQVAFNASNYDFGDVTVGESARLTATLTNIGTAEVTFQNGNPRVISLASPNPYSMAATTCESTLAPAQACSITVDFSPQVVGSPTGNIVVRINESSDLFFAGLRGTATFPVAECPYEDHLVLQNRNVVGVEIHPACRTVTVGPNFTVQSTGDLTLVAGERIRLRPGFRVMAGGQLAARVDSTDPLEASSARDLDANDVGLLTSAQLSGGAPQMRTSDGPVAHKLYGVSSVLALAGSPFPIPSAEIEGSAAQEPALQAPLGLTALAGDASVALHWQPVPQTDGYTVYWSRAPNIHSYTARSYEGFVENMREARIIVSGLENDTEYFFVVTASHGRLESPSSLEIAATPAAGPLLIAERYRLTALDAPTMVDMTTGLEWQRCALGQQWESADCTGFASTYSHAEAQQAAAAFNGSRTPEEPAWRLPEIGELRGLVYCTSGVPAHFPEGTGCWGSHGIPTLEPTVFPTGTAAGGWFWSSTAETDGRAWGVDFDRGTAQPYQASAFSGLRLVRPKATGLD